MYKLKWFFKRFCWFVLAVVLMSIMLVLSLRWLDPPMSSIMLVDRLLSNYTQKHHWVPISKISSQLSIAVVAAEDQKFPNHYGFDFESIVSAVNEKRKRIRGASTITQQVAKNLFLWGGRSYFRKALEAYFTVLIEMCWSKQRILETYLNIVEFGPGIYGAQAASYYYFKKPARYLNLDESVLLAAVLPSPKRMHVNKPSAYVRTRANEIKAVTVSLGGVRYLHF